MIVTGFVDLEPWDGAPRRRPASDYTERAAWLWSSGLPVTCFADRPPLAERGYLPADFHPSPLDLLSVTQALASGKQRRIAWDPQKDTPAYFCLMRHRLKWILRAAAWWGPDTYWWLDYGYRFQPEDRLADLLELKPPPGRIRIAELSHVPGWARAARESFYCTHWWPVAGGVLAGRSEDFEWLDARVEEEWRWALDNGYAVTDEMMLGWIRYQHPERFDVYYADHPTLVTNYLSARASHELILHMAERARLEGDHVAADAREEAVKRALSRAAAAR